MDNKGLPRSQYSGYESQTGARKPQLQRKAYKKHQNILNDGRLHGPGPGSNPEHGFNLFNNRSLSVLSTMHHLNAHRKVAMSPEILREAEEQVTSLRKAVKQLQEQLEKTNREKARIHRFLSDLLYTLNARGYESVRDHEGTLVDLNKCKGETYLDLKGRDLKQRVNVRRQGGQEFLLKAVIGNQERAIQSLVYKLDSIGRDIVLGNRLTMDDTTTATTGSDSPRVASLESEVLQLVNLIEGACQRCPEMYGALRDHYYLNEGNEASELSPRNPVLHNLLKKCEQIAGDVQSRQLVEMLSCSNTVSNKIRPKNATPSNGSSKAVKNKQSSKTKTGNSKALRAVSSDTVGASSRALLESICGQSFDGHLKPLNGASRSDNSLQQKPPPSPFRSAPHCTFTPPCPDPDCSGGILGPINNNSGGEPTSSFLNSSKSTAVDHFIKDCSVSVCPYCHRKFGLEESISEIKNHIEMHVFAGDATLP